VESYIVPQVTYPATIVTACRDQTITQRHAETYVMGHLDWAGSDGNLFIYLIFLAFLTAFGLVVLSPLEKTC